MTTAVILIPIPATVALDKECALITLFEVSDGSEVDDPTVTDVTDVDVEKPESKLVVETCGVVSVVPLVDVVDVVDVVDPVPVVLVVVVVLLPPEIGV